MQGTMLTPQIGLKANLHAQCKPTLSLGSLGQVTCANSSCRYVTVLAASLQQTYMATLVQSGEAKSKRAAGGFAACPAAHFGPAGSAQAGLGVMQARPCSRNSPLALRLLQLPE